MLRSRFLLVAFPLLMLAACGRSSQPAPTAPVGQLPPLSSLHGNGITRGTSSTSFELMGTPPVAISPTGVDTSGSQLSLNPPSDAMSWAVYALEGFPTDGSVVPVSVSIDRTTPCWVAFGDFSKNKWEFAKADNIGGIVPASTSLLSPNGTFFIAVIGYPDWNNNTGATSVTSLMVHTSSDVVLPTPVLNILSATGDVAAGIPTFYNADGSLAGNGAASMTITYDWNDGTPIEQVTDPLQEMNHTWSAAGAHKVSLTVENDLGASATKQFYITVQNAFDEMLVVYNSDIPESADLKDYYCGSRYGRSIDPVYILGLPLGTDANADFSRATYDSTLRDPIRTHLDASGYKDTIKYILLLKGVPHRISDGAGSAAVDSELCLLYSAFDPAQGDPYAWLINDPEGFVYFLGQNGDGFYLEDDAGFVANTYQVCYDPTWDQPSSGDEVPYTLNYLVGRLSAYTYDESKLLVDRSIAADKSGQGWSILDSRPGTYGQDSDRMVDPVWPFTNNTADCGYDLLSTTGFNVYQELTNDLVTNNYVNLPSGAGDAVLAYCSWGIHSGHNRDYILTDLQFTYLPGACFMSYESFNAWNFDGDNLGNHAGQGQICEFLRMGGTCAIGNCWEPYTVGVGDERWVFSRYIIHGDRWIEAAYKGMPLLSWMEVVVGDPLCQVK